MSMFVWNIGRTDPDLKVLTSRQICMDFIVLMVGFPGFIWLLAVDIVGGGIRKMKHHQKFLPGYGAFVNVAILSLCILLLMVTISAFIFSWIIMIRGLIRLYKGDNRVAPDLQDKKPSADEHHIGIDSSQQL